MKKLMALFALGVALSAVVFKIYFYGIDNSGFEVTNLNEPAIESSHSTVGTTVPSQSSTHVAPGMSAVYSYEYNVQGTLEEGSESQEPDLMVNGELHVRVLKVEDKRIYLGMQLRGGTINLGLETGDFEFGVLLNVIDTKGFLVEQVTSKSLDDQSAYFVTEQFNIQSTRSEVNQSIVDQWSSLETDNVGRYKASYKYLPSGALEKTKTEYVTILDKSLGDLDIIQSYIQIKPGGLWLDSYESMESVSNKIEDLGEVNYTETQHLNMLQGHDHQTLFLNQISLSLNRDELINVIQNQDLSEVLSFGSQDASLEEASENPLSSLPFEHVMSELQVSVMNAKTHADTLNSIELFSDWLIVNPERSDMVYHALLENEKLSADVTARMIHALAIAGNGLEAQETLHKIISDTDLSFDVRLQGIVATSDLQEINSTNLIGTLWEQSMKVVDSNDIAALQISDSSLYALGTLASKDAQLASQLEMQLQPILKNSPSLDPEYTKVAIRALQNIGVNSPETLNAVSNIFENNMDEGVRVAALEMLHTEDSGVFYPIASKALQDVSKRVRLAAVRELSATNTGNEVFAAQSLMNQVNLEQDEGVVGAIYLALGNYRESNPDVEAFLKANMTTANDNIKEYISQALQ